MSGMFDEIKKGLTEAIEYEKGIGSAKLAKYSIDPVKEFSNKEIRRIRMDANMSQSVFALFMGVSKKTVEAWEKGRTHPTGSACRLLDILSSGKADDLPFLSIEN